MLKPLFVSVSYHPIGQSKSRVPSYSQEGASQVALVVKNQPVNAGDTRDVGSIPGSGRSPGIGNSNPLQYCCVENPMDRGAWWATVHRIAKSQTWLKQLNTHIYAVYMSIPISQFILLLFFPLVVHTFILYICVSTWFAKINFIVVWLIHKEIHIFKVYISIGLDICKQPQYHHHNQGNKRVQLLPKSPCIPLCMCVCVC